MLPLEPPEGLGWGPFFQQQIESNEIEDLLPARVVEENRGLYTLFAAPGPLRASLPGRLLYGASGREELPTVGDWVLARRLPGEDRAIIERVLERRSKLARKEAGETSGEQIMAANVDAVFVVASVSQELNLRRIERYLAVVWESGATPVVLLNKADLCGDVESLVHGVEAIAPGVPVHATSAETGEGLDALAGYLAGGQTAVFVGSSGVGKSSLVNRLLAEPLQAVADVRGDGKGRHTTSTRQMLVLPGGGLIIDTPGLREIGLSDVESGVGRAFVDLEALARECAFRDCRHSGEPGCAVGAAIDEGTLDSGRLESYRKLEREREFIGGRRDQRLRANAKKRWKQIAKANRQRERAGWR